MVRVAGLALLVAVALAACNGTCDAVTCAFGCCEAGRCYEGTLVKQGNACSAGTGGGGGGMDNPGSGGGVSSGAGGGTGGSCVELGDPCNAALGLYCCTSSSSSDYNYVCKSDEHCGLCLKRAKECSGPSSTSCCSGTSCQLRAGFSSVYECR